MASEGDWLPTACPRCAGDNQRTKNWQQRMYWWSNPLDSMCGLCRCEQEAEEQEYAERNQRYED
jgi:hypothetical protein